MRSIRKSPSAIARAAKWLSKYPGFKVFHNGVGQIVRKIPKVRSMEVERDGRKIVITGKSLRRHRIKMKRAEREAAKAGA